jgi:hypothetical protein
LNEYPKNRGIVNIVAVIELVVDIPYVSKVMFEVHVVPSAISACLSISLHMEEIRDSLDLEYSK